LAEVWYEPIFPIFAPVVNLFLPAYQLAHGIVRFRCELLAGNYAVATVYTAALIILVRRKEYPWAYGMFIFSVGHVDFSFGSAPRRVQIEEVKASDCSRVKHFGILT
jgi:hypothetical protein